MPLAVQSYARGRAISAGFRIELNDVDGVARTRHVDTHAAGELVAADHGMNGIADGASAHAARGVVGGLAPGAGDRPAAIGELGACVELIVGFRRSAWSARRLRPPRYR